MPVTVEWVEQCREPVKDIRVETPAGWLRVSVSGDVMVGCDWIIETDSRIPGDRKWQNLFDAYWHDSKIDLAVKVLMQGTPFRRRVWAELCRIPFGETRTYAALAHVLASSPRAVGNACRDNPYAPLIPCHRVVSSAGLGGYCGVTEGALMDVKIKLLQFEAEHCR
jgi:methylated-DNA-[protein]-cysteine S-methyltransferase